MTAHTVDADGDELSRDAAHANALVHAHLRVAMLEGEEDKDQTSC
jgi:hypothetical protein